MKTNFYIHLNSIKSGPQVSKYCKYHHNQRTKLRNATREIKPKPCIHCGKTALDPIERKTL